MKATKFSIPFFIAIFCISCNTKRKYESRTNDRLNGYWIPTKIGWHSPKTGISEIDANTNVADFFILCFDSLGQCDLVNSTQTKLNTSDSIGVEYEPGMELWKGEYNCLDSACSILKVILRPIPDENGRFYHGDKSVIDTIKVVYKQNETHLFFRNKSYFKTRFYDSFSTSKIEKLRRLKY